MQKIKVGHRAKFRARNKYFLQILFPVRADFTQDLTSGVLILSHSADACVLRARVQLKPFRASLTILKLQVVQGFWNSRFYRVVQLIKNKDQS